MNHSRTRTAVKDVDAWHALRAHNIGGTEIAALFGLHPWLTKYQLWHAKKAQTQLDEKRFNERMFWGKCLEPAIAGGIAKLNGWALEPANDYFSLNDIGIGATLDYLRVDCDPLQIAEIKYVDRYEYSEKWGRNEAPYHYELQLQHQMLVSGLESGMLVPMVGGNSIPQYIERSPSELIHGAIIEEAQKFWTSINENKPPTPEYERDYRFIIAASSAAPGKTIEIDKETLELAEEYQRLSDIIRSNEKRRGVIKAKILERIGDAEKVVGDNVSITAGMIGEVLVKEHTRKAYRRFSVKTRKVKDDNERN